MDDIILRVSRHYITGIIGVLGLAATTYLMRRYFSNNEKTTNAYYTRTDELDNTMNGATSLSLETNPSARKITIFWNGSFNSTYLLLDYLQQDFIIQPLYVEKYTIRKALEHEQLQKYTTEYNASRETGAQCNSKVLEYLADVARIKKQQEKEISQMTILRRVIMNQYSEFRANLLPTRYITTIEKDLAHSQVFYNELRKLDLSPLQYAGIEFFEQAARYVAHLSQSISSQSSKNTNNSLDTNSKIVFGYSQDSHLTSIILHIIQILQLTQYTNRNQSKQYQLELPLSRISNNTIKYLATEKINKEVIRFLS
jgi:hypothetical protein